MTDRLFLAVFVLLPLALRETRADDRFLYLSLPLLALALSLGIRTVLMQTRRRDVVGSAPPKEYLLAGTAGAVVAAVSFGLGTGLRDALLAFLIALLVYLLVLLLAMFGLLVAMLGYFVLRMWQMGTYLGVWASCIAGCVALALTGPLVALAAGAEMHNRVDLTFMFGEQGSGIDTTVLTLARAMMIGALILFLLVALLSVRVKATMATRSDEARELKDVERSLKRFMPLAGRRK